MLFLQKRELRSLWGAISTKKGAEVFMGCYSYKKRELMSLWGAISTKKGAEVFMGCYFYKKMS
jgi:serine/threonine-protein kinase RIO1